MACPPRYKANLLPVLGDEIPETLPPGTGNIAGAPGTYYQNIVHFDLDPQNGMSTFVPISETLLFLLTKSPTSISSRYG